MGKNKKADNFGFIFSTNSNFEYDNSEQDEETLDPSRQKLRILLDKKNRKGKKDSVILTPS